MNENYIPHGVGKLYKGARTKDNLLFHGSFFEGRPLLSDIVKKNKKDEQVFKWVEKLGGCHFLQHRIRAVSCRGEPSSCT